MTASGQSLYFGEICDTKSFFTPAFFAMRPHVFAVRWKISFALSLSFSKE
jgi:hypothetical protein